MEYTLSTDALVRQCREHDGSAAGEQSCFELFRRALEDGDERAFHHVYVLHFPLIQSWIGRDSLFPRGREDAGVFAHDTLVAFYRACQGERFTTIFPTKTAFDEILKYLHKCARSQLWQYWRRQKRRPTEPLLPEHDVEHRDDRAAEQESTMLYRHILNTVFTTDHERQSFAVFFILGWNPRDIPAHFPALATSDNTARTLKTRIIQILRRAARTDRFLREWLERPAATNPDTS